MDKQARADVGVLMTAIQLAGLELILIEQLVKQNLVPDHESAEALLEGVDSWSQGI